MSGLAKVCREALGTAHGSAPTELQCMESRCHGCNPCPLAAMPASWLDELDLDLDAATVKQLEHLATQVRGGRAGCLQLYGSLSRTAAPQVGAVASTLKDMGPWAAAAVAAADLYCPTASSEAQLGVGGAEGPEGASVSDTDNEGGGLQAFAATGTGATASGTTLGLSDVSTAGAESSLEDEAEEAHGAPPPPDWLLDDVAGFQLAALMDKGDLGDSTREALRK